MDPKQSFSVGMLLLVGAVTVVDSLTCKFKWRLGGVYTLHYNIRDAEHARCNILFVRL